MMYRVDQIKPFDLAIVESPYEYGFATKQERRSLMEFAAFCRIYDIPVRLHCVGSGKGLSFVEVDDSCIDRCFSGCDYKNHLPSSELYALKGENPHVLLTGGLLLYDDASLDAKVRSSGIDQADVSNYALDKERPFAFVKGCVAMCADYLSRSLYSLIGDRPDVVIHMKSVVKDDDPFNTDADCKFYLGGTTRMTLDDYRVVEILWK